ncbi:LOW QUALITY PROTEIN: hypothetical protein U9M48_010951 [Paspalum notatum var. saurae]|uniref:BPL/LPL catalytic domain-containing protein n=1 Tax=Paspalum notatum var. saurae TaxID=547442 RepID=A0AAQ3SUL9_PASNO
MEEETTLPVAAGHEGGGDGGTAASQARWIGYEEEAEGERSEGGMGSRVDSGEREHSSGEKTRIGMNDLDGLAGACGTARPLMRLVNMSGMPILRQLQVEECLLRRTTDNWCIINDGTAPPSIVLGSRGSVLEFVEIQSVLRDRVPVVKRFSRGGTVVVDHGTVFVTLICNHRAVAGLESFPRDIMSWSSQLYGKVLCVSSHSKFGGNAQYIATKRWLHHTSFLWDYDNMDYLKIPKCAPEYRLGRSHTDFLCRMKDYIPSRSFFLCQPCALPPMFFADEKSSRVEAGSVCRAVNTSPSRSQAKSQVLKSVHAL